MKLLDCCSINPKKVNKFEGERKYIATGDIINNKINTYSNVTFENRPSRANIMIAENDVLFAKMKNTQKVILGSKENIQNIYSTGFYCLTPNDKIKPKLLYYYLCSKLFNNLKDSKCTGATIGKTAIATDENYTCKTLLQKSVALLRPNKEKILPEFLQYCYICNESLYNKGQGCARKNLLISQIKNTRVFVPPLNLQKEFVLLVEQLEKQIKMCECDINDLECLLEQKMYRYFN